MEPALLFHFTTGLAFTGWLALLVFPHSRLAVHVWAKLVVPITLAIAYVCFMVSYWHLSPAEGSFTSLDGLAAFFTIPGLMLAGWLHYLIFDLMFGVWLLGALQRRGYHHLAVCPLLVLCMIAAPTGLLVSVAVLALTNKDIDHITTTVTP